MDARRASRAREGVLAAAETAESLPVLFADVVAQLRRALPVDGWCGHTLDPATSMPTGGESREGYDPALLSRLLQIEYVEGDVNAFAQLLQQTAPVGVLHDSTGGRPERSARYRDVIAPSGFEHELRVVLRQQGRPWGALVLIRAEDSPAFGEAESQLMASVSTALAEAVKRLLLRQHVEAGGLPESPGLLLLDEDLRVETRTPEAARWLAELGRGDATELPVSVVALASSAASTRGTVRSRSRLPSGGWVTMTAWSLGGGRVAVSLESSAPHDLTALALEAYSLSAREREVVQLVLLGCSTADIARRLFVSPYTVQDHLKSVFEKTGVRSRRELAADLFFRHYLPRIERGAAPGPEGWFVT